MVRFEEIVGDDLIVVVRSMRKGALAIAVAQGPDARYIGLQLIVNDDVAAAVARNASPIKPEVVRVGSTSYRQKNMSAQCFRRAFEAFHADSDFAFMLRQRYTFRVQPNPYPFSFQ